MEILEAADVFSLSGRSDISGDGEYSFASPVATGSEGENYQMHPYHNGFTPPHLSPPIWQEGYILTGICT